MPQPPSPNPSAQSSPEPANLRISSQPMDATAAQAQVQFALETDSQLTQGSASLIHTVPNAPVGPLPAVQAAPTSSQGVYNVAQYTPSAQEAATGAYSAPSSKLARSNRARSSPLPRRQSRKPAQPQPGTSGKRRNSRPRRPSATLPSQAILRQRALFPPVRNHAGPGPANGNAGREPRADHHRNGTHGSGTRAAQSASAAWALGACPARSQSLEPARRGGDAVAGYRERL